MWKALVRNTDAKRDCEVNGTVIVPHCYVKMLSRQSLNVVKHTQFQINQWTWVSGLISGSCPKTFPKLLHGIPGRGMYWTADMSPAAPPWSTCSMSILGPIQIKGLHANDIKHVFIAFNESQGETNKSSKAKLLLLPPGGLWKWPRHHREVDTDR